MTNILKTSFPVFLLLQILSFVALAADEIQIREDAPSRYEVVDGDTLWDISGRFLEDPWLWPEVWELNPQIENPHLIYPGDVIALIYSADGPMLTLSRGGTGVPDVDGLRTVRLSPQVRWESLSAIPAIPLDRISSFLSSNLVVSQSDIDNAPYLFANRGGTLLSSDDDVIYAKGNWDPVINRYDIIRGGMAYVDPETNEVVGVEGRFLGSATIIKREGNNATLTITDLMEEVREGDRFIPAAANTIDANYFPVPPDVDINGSILGISSGRSLGDAFYTIVINWGSSSRLEVGDLLGLQKPGLIVEDNYQEVTLLEKFYRALGYSEDHIETFSGQIFASVLIYRVFDNTSLGIILSTDEIVRKEDKVITP